MVKGKITVPKTEQACKDGKCGHPHEIPFEISDSKPEIMAPATLTIDSGPQVTQMLQAPHNHPQGMA